MRTAISTAWTILLCALFLGFFAKPAEAQTVSGSLMGATWRRPNGACNGASPEPATTRAYTVFTYSITTPGAYSVTATRTSGAGIYMDVYQPFIPGAGNECVNRWFLNGAGSDSATTVSQTVTQGGPLNGGTVFFSIVVSGTSASDTGTFSISVAGPQSVVTQCGFNASGFFTPSSQSAGSAGGNFSAVYTPSPGAGCSTSSTISGIPAWITGFPSNVSGASTINYTVQANGGAARNVTLSSSGGGSLSVSQSAAPTCSVSVSPTNSSVGVNGGGGSFSVTAPAGCAWTTSGGAGWLSGVTASGTGSGTVSFTAGANTGPARSTGITVTATQGGSASTFTLNQPSGCAVALSPSSTTPDAAGGSASFNVSTAPGCAWTASSAAGFLSNITPGGTGSGSVSYTVAANPGIARTASITVTATATSQAATFTVDQSNGCVYSLASNSTNVGATGGTASVTLNASSSTCPWSAASGAPWITGVTASGNGTTSVAYTVAQNLGPARSATITAGGQSFAVNQADGCVASLPASSTSVAVAGETKSFALTLSDATCPWAASSTASWLTAITPSGSGSGSVSFTAAANTGVSRSAIITAGGRDFQVQQASGCTVSLPVTAASAVVAGGSSSFVVNTAAGCAYTVSSSSPWLTASVGAGGVDYTTSASSAASRVGTITVQSTTTASSATFQVTQASGCLVMLSASGASLPAAGQSARVDVTSGAGCTWQAVAGETWITDVVVDAGGVSYRVAAHDGPTRSSVIHVSNAESGGSADFAVTQESGCVVSLASSLLVPAAGGAQSLPVTTGAGCGLSVSGGAGWITNSSLTGAALHFDVAENDGVARTEVLSVSAPDSGSSQDLTVSQSSGCSIHLPVDLASFSEAAASASFTVSSGPGCTWTAASVDDWIENVSPTASGVDYGVTTNTGVARTTLISVSASDTGASQTFTIEQAGTIVPPTIIIQPSAVRVEEGSPFELSVVAAGGSLSYAWFRDGMPLAGAEGRSFGSATARVEDSASYYVVVTNPAGSVTSDEVEVDVFARPDVPDEGDAGSGAGGAPNVDDPDSGGAPNGNDSDSGGAPNADDPDSGGALNAGGDQNAGRGPTPSDQEGFDLEPGGGGCSCRVSGVSGARGATMLSGLLALGLLLRRRARSRRAP